MLTSLANFSLYNVVCQQDGVCRCKYPQIKVYLFAVGQHATNSHYSDVRILANIDLS